MYTYYTKLALRAFARFKLYTFINVVSLTFGFFCFICTVVALVYFDSFDRHHPGAERIYSVRQGGSFEGTSMSGSADSVFVAKPVAEYLRTEFPDIGVVARATIPQDEYPVTVGDTTRTPRIRFVEPEFLAIFPQAIVNDPEPAVTLAPNTALITYDVALNLFGSTDVVGRQMTVSGMVDVTVAGVMPEAQYLSHVDSPIAWFSSDVIMHTGVFDRLQGAGLSDADDWTTLAFFTYVKFKDGTDQNAVAQFESQLGRFAGEIIPASLGYSASFSIQPVNQLIPSMFGDMFGGGSITRLMLISGSLVLLVAALNYSILVNAQLIQRNQEVVVQKIMGARRNQLLKQYSYESALMVLICLALGFLLVSLPMNALIDSDVIGVSYRLLFSLKLWLALLLVVPAIVLISGTYPIFHVARTRLAGLLQSKGTDNYSHGLHMAIVSVQFLISSTILILLFVSNKQNAAMFQRVEGTENRHVLLDARLFDSAGVDVELLSTELTQSPHILSTTRTKRAPWALGQPTKLFSTSDDFNAPKIAVLPQASSYDFFETLEIPFIAGRDFSREQNDILPSVQSLAMASGPYSIVIDEITAAKLGWENPADAVGETIYQHLLPPEVPSQIAIQHSVIGVVEHKPLDLLNVGANSSIYVLQPAESMNMTVRVSRDNIVEAIKHLELVWAELAPFVPLQRMFMEQRFSGQYIFAPVSSMIATMAVFAFLISSIGLIGIASFTTSLRHREVGVRKVLGASKWRILRMLMLDFSKPVIVASLAAWPVGYVLSRIYLSIFTEQVELSIFPFLVSFLITTGIAWIAVGRQALISSRIRPASTLKYE
jgi:putative ABC transport system permease protein